jgi:nitrate reductase (NAD(P)H)
MHGETVPISFESERPFVIKGYAYTGGGNKIIRTEISFDKGENWDLAELYYDPKAIRHQSNHLKLSIGKHWCWTFFEYTVKDKSKLIRCEEILVRAWDSSMNCQPEKLNWNVMGMMNNCWFRIKVHFNVKETGFELVFQHPTNVNLKNNSLNGWMEENTFHVNTVPPPSPLLLPSSGSLSNLKQFTIQELKSFDKNENCMIIVDRNVYDCTTFLREHPGGFVLID